MSVTFHIPGALREFTSGQSKVEVRQSAADLSAALSALWVLYPGLRDRILNEQGEIREHINIFIGDEAVRYTGGLRSPLPMGSEIAIVPAISGGLIPMPARCRRLKVDNLPMPTCSCLYSFLT